MKPNRPLLFSVAVALLAVSCQTPPGPAQTPAALPTGRHRSAAAVGACNGTHSDRRRRSSGGHSAVSWS